ncbi:MAG: O-antigen ligase family protein [Cyanobacteria bacterium P01_F01_bin.4]
MLQAQPTQKLAVIPWVEWPFWMAFGFWSLWPESKTPSFEFEGVPFSSRDGVLIAIALYYFGSALAKQVLTQQTVAYPQKAAVALLKPWHFYLPLATAGLVLYASVSLTTSGLDDLNRLAMGYTLVLLGAACMLAYGLVAHLGGTALRSFLWRLTVAIAAVGLLYTAVTFFSVGIGGIRSQANSIAGEVGVGRATGPLFGASTGYFILLPALAYAIQELFLEKALFKAAVVFSLLLTLMSLGSRGSIICISIFFIFAFFSIKNKKQAAIAALLTLLLMVPAAGVVSSKAGRVTDRFQSFEASDRTESYTTSFAIVENRSAEMNLLGSGYGSIWAWYLPLHDRDSDLMWTPFGYLLFQPHSTFLLLWVELGLIGGFYFLMLWAVLLLSMTENFKQALYPLFNCGMAASGFAMFFDTFLIMGAVLSTVWWIFLFGSLSINAQKPVRPHSP